jgi:hypothetical protein
MQQKTCIYCCEETTILKQANKDSPPSWLAAAAQLCLRADSAADKGQHAVHWQT